MMIFDTRGYIEREVHHSNSNAVKKLRLQQSLPRIPTYEKRYNTTIYLVELYVLVAFSALGILLLGACAM